MRRVLFTAILMLFMSNATQAETIAVQQSEQQTIAAASTTASTVVIPTQHATRAAVSECCDTITASPEQLFYLTLAALNKMNYKIKEVQSKTGTVLFQVASREFLITIAHQDSNNTFIKILPTDSNYAFSPALVQNIFSFLKANSKTAPIVL